MSTLILSLGNPLRADDGVGAAVLSALTGRVPPHIDLLDGGTPGLETALLMEGRARVIVLDAADMGLEPGTWRRFTTEEVLLGRRNMTLRGTLHYAGLAEALTLAEALGIMPGEIVVYGVQPATVDWSIGLSPAVEGAIPAVVDAVLAEVA